MEGVIPPRGLQPRGFLTQKIMKEKNSNNFINRFKCDEK